MLLLPHYTLATRVYKSIDADGNVTYSSHPPPDAVSVETIMLGPDLDISPGADSKANITAIKKLADQLEKDRKQRERKREQVQKQAESGDQHQPTAPETIIRYYPILPFYYSPYIAPPYISPPRRPRPHRPRHPYSPPEQPLPPPLKRAP